MAGKAGATGQWEQQQVAAEGAGFVRREQRGAGAGRGSTRPSGSYVVKAAQCCMADVVVVMMVVVAAGSRGGAGAPTSRLVTLAVGRRGPASARATAASSSNRNSRSRAMVLCARQRRVQPERAGTLQAPALSLPAEVSRRCMFRSWSRSAFFVSLHASFSAFLFLSLPFGQRASQAAG